MRAKSKKAPARDDACNRAVKRIKLSADIEDTSAELFNAEQIDQIRSSLLCWYDANHRILPWRRNYHSKVLQDPSAEIGTSLEMPIQQFTYGIWVSEVMSQQTQVPRAALYWKKWIARWPTVKDLAKASIEEVNEMWAGLGYYRRAKYLLDGAAYVTNELQGSFPTTAAELQKIPGVGAYTGAAIASIASGEQVAAVDANVMRILARLRCLDWELKEVKAYSRVARELVDPERPGDFNQALMELGASVCTIHQAPSCSACPLQDNCRAYGREKAKTDAEASFSVMQYPVKSVKAKRREETAACCVVKVLHSNGKVYYLLVARPSKGLLAGLYEMPLQLVDAECEAEGDTQVMDGYLEQILGNALSRNDLAVIERRKIGTVSHTFSHIQLTLRVQLLVVKGDMDVSRREVDEGKGLPGLKWITAQELAAGGLSSSVAKVFKLVSKASAEATGIRKFFATK